MRKIYILMLLFIVLNNIKAVNKVVGKKAPDFVIETYNEKKITKNNFKEIYYAFVFEGKNGERKNLPVRIKVEAFITCLPPHLRKKIIFFAIADVHGYVSLIHGIIRNRVRKNIKREKIPIYLDFEGHILKRYNMLEDETNFVLVDDKGIVRFAYRGIVKKKEIKKVVNYLMKSFKPYLRNYNIGFDILTGLIPVR